MNTRTTLTIALPAFFMLLGGCIIIPGPDAGPDGGSTGGTGNTTKTSSSSSSSGDGGAAVGGAGGAGGGGGNCAGPNDGMLDVLTCDKLNTQAIGNVCGPNKDLAPLSIGTCTHGSSIFQGGAFDVLAKCLQNIAGDMTNACDDAQVAKCVDVMYKTACPSQDSATTCEAIAKNLCIKGEIFDTQGCSLDTNPLNPKALQTLADCISGSVEPDCNKAYTVCFGQVISF